MSRQIYQNGISPEMSMNIWLNVSDEESVKTVFRKILHKDGSFMIIDCSGLWDHYDEWIYMITTAVRYTYKNALL